MFLLQAVVEFSNGTLNPEYCDFHVALALIKSQPALTTMLHAAWNSGTYRDIRNLEILQIPRLRTMEDTLHRAFIAPYHGNAVDAFHEYLEINNKKFAHGSDDGPPKYYGKYCSIIQSSGTGKSRLMLELCTKGVIVLYVNLRPSDDYTGFPARDDVPAEILAYPSIDAVDYGQAFGAAHSLQPFSQQSMHPF